MFSVCCWIACSFVLLLVVDGFFFCVFSFWLAFRFALFLVRISVLIAFPVCSVSVPEHGMQKSAAALRCRLFPESIRRHRRDRRDIDPMAGPESSPISDGRMEDHPFPRRIDLVHLVRNRPGRPPPHFFSWTDIGSK